MSNTISQYTTSECVCVFLPDLFLLDVWPSRDTTNGPTQTTENEGCEASRRARHCKCCFAILLYLKKFPNERNNTPSACLNVRRSRDNVLLTSSDR